MKDHCGEFPRHKVSLRRTTLCNPSPDTRWQTSPASPCWYPHVKLATEDHANDASDNKYHTQMADPHSDMELIVHTDHLSAALYTPGTGYQDHHRRVIQQNAGYVQDAVSHLSESSGHYVIASALELNDWTSPVIGIRRCPEW
jgi:hypothetical protein